MLAFADPAKLTNWVTTHETNESFKDRYYGTVLDVRIVNQDFETDMEYYWRSFGEPHQIVISSSVPQRVRTTIARMEYHRLQLLAGQTYEEAVQTALSWSIQHQRLFHQILRRFFQQLAEKFACSEDSVSQADIARTLALLR